MSTESKHPKIDWPPFDHSMTAGPHVKFEIYHGDERRKKDPNDPTDILNAAHLALRPLGWQIGSMAFVDPRHDEPPQGREPLVAKLDELIRDATRLRQDIIDGEYLGALSAYTLEGLAEELQPLLRDIEDAEDTADAALTSGQIGDGS